MNYDDKLDENWDKLIAEAEESEYTVNDGARKKAIIDAASAKYITANGNIDIPNDAQVHHTVDGDYWVDAMVFISHADAFKAPSK